MDLIDYNGKYNYRQFTAGEFTFTLVGSSYETLKQKPMDGIDTFKSSNGVFSDRKRSEVYKAFHEGKIRVVESSLITK